MEPPSTPDSVSGHRNGARRPLLSHLRCFCLCRHGLLPLPHGRGDDRELGPQARREARRVGFPPRNRLCRSPLPRFAAWRSSARSGSCGGQGPPLPGRLILAIHSPTCALLCTTRAGHLPPHAASRSPCRKGSAPHARTLAGVGSRREQCFCRTNPDTKRTHRTVAVSRGAEGNVPCRPPHRPPLSAPVHTSNQQRRRARRAEVRSVAGSAAADSPPSNKPEASKSRKPRARPLTATSS